jgi:hypothetical protein
MMNARHGGTMFLARQLYAIVVPPLWRSLAGRADPALTSPAQFKGGVEVTAP